MDAKRWHDIERIFFEALDASAEERDRYLAIECGADAGLRAEIEALLKSAGDDPMLEIEKRLENTMSPAPVMPTTGQTIGRYKLKGLLGQGGMVGLLLYSCHGIHGHAHDYVASVLQIVEI